MALHLTVHGTKRPAQRFRLHRIESGTPLRITRRMLYPIQPLQVAPESLR
jgi:hypothetical protein